ncbi:MAG: hypothetical protein HYT67_00250 [Candidatus Yanofskybacteria bacterium]|nr:hypothetical protein [Candidatus Yanofskybacteria bacterium]
MLITAETAGGSGIEQKIGFIGVCGTFRKDADSISLTEEDKETVQMMCQMVHNMPSEYGCLGVGESPTMLWDEYCEFMKRNNIRHNLD